MHTVLMVAYYFPPLATSGAMRPLAFCRHLHACGWTPRVLAADPASVKPPLPLDRELAARLPSGLRVERIAHPAPLDALIRLRDRWRRTAAAPAAAGECRPEAARRPRSRMRALLVEHLFDIPDPQRWWETPAVRAGVRGERPDVVYATGGPWTALLVGRTLARRLGVPFVADFRDPWTRNPFRAYSPSAWQRSRRLERSVCRSAARVVLNTIELRDQFAADYPDLREKFVAIPNGFDPLPGTDGSVAGAGAAAGGRTTALELWHFGTVYGRRSPGPLLEALAALFDSGRCGPDRLRVRFVGSWEVPDDDPASRLARRLEQVGLVTREPPVPHQACLALMGGAQALLVLQADSPLQVPGKIYEYIATRRPLVVVGGEGATASLVARHRLGRACPNAVEPIRQLLAELAAGARLAPPPAGEVERFDYQRLTRQLADVFAAALCDGAPLAAAAAC